MVRDDPLEQLLWVTTESPLPDMQDRVRQRFWADIETIEQLLALPSVKKPIYPYMGYGRWATPTSLQSAEIERVQTVFQRVLDTGGTNIRHVQSATLMALAIALEPALIPFWLHVLELARPRDAFTSTRRRLAMAALSLLVIIADSPEALETLKRLLDHSNPEVREITLQYFREIYKQTEQSIPDDMRTLFLSAANQDTSFQARFQARLLCYGAEPFPVEPPRGVYHFKVKFKYAKTIWRTIAIRADQAFNDLQWAIQSAFKWDNDHLYAFFLNGERYNETYEISHPYSEAGISSAEMLVGQVGFVEGHTFLYLFDFGDNHEFLITVDQILPKAERGKYPRVIASHGKAPAQYHWDEG